MAEKKLEIEMPADELQGRYCNLAVISHDPSEFFIDLILRGPNMPKARVQSRVIMAPEHAKSLLYALKQNIDNYEKNFGEIQPRQPRRQGVDDGIMDFPLPQGQA